MTPAQLCFKYSCLLSSLFWAANEAGIELDDVVSGDMNLDDKRQNADNNGEEEVDDTLINLSKNLRMNLTPPVQKMKMRKKMNIKKDLLRSKSPVRNWIILSMILYLAQNQMMRQL